jgi:hypothetical protein
MLQNGAKSRTYIVEGAGHTANLKEGEHLRVLLP